MPQSQHDLSRRSRCHWAPALVLARALSGLWLLTAAAAYAETTDRCRRLPSCAPPAFAAPASASEPIEFIDGPLPEAIPGDVPIPADDAGGFEIHALARGYYLNDQRIEWSGLEATLGAEAQIAPAYRQRYGDWEVAALGDFYINQPFDRNQLADTPERRSYHGNWEVETFQISNLLLSAQYDKWLFAVGKMETPFGRYYTPLYSNLRLDAPFIRTEVINWRETGLLARGAGDLFVLDAGVMNGGEDRDANSSKALVSRLGMQRPNWAVGASVKYQDGIGSESQKTYDNQVGADLMFRCGGLTISGEIVWDEYGLRRPGFDLNNITWGRSIYYRDLNKAFHQSITGYGYYVDVAYQGERWFASLNYGAYHPEQLGVPEHDVVNRRGILKLARDIIPQWQVYTALIRETDGYRAQDNRLRQGSVILVGFQAKY